MRLQCIQKLLKQFLRANNLQEMLTDQTFALLLFLRHEISTACFKHKEEHTQRQRLFVISSDLMSPGRAPAAGDEGATDSKTNSSCDRMSNKILGLVEFLHENPSMQEKNYVSVNL